MKNNLMRKCNMIYISKALERNSKFHLRKRCTVLDKVCRLCCHDSWISTKLFTLSFCFGGKEVRSLLFKGFNINFKYVFT